MNNLFSGLLGDIKGDVAVNVSFDPLSSLLLAVFIMLAIVLSHFVVKVVL